MQVQRYALLQAISFTAIEQQNNVESVTEIARRLMEVLPAVDEISNDAAQLAIGISSNVMRVGRTYHAEVPAIKLLLQSLDSAALAMRRQESFLTQLPTMAPTEAPTTHFPTMSPTVFVNNTQKVMGSSVGSSSSSSLWQGQNLRGRHLAAVPPSGQPSGQPSSQPSGAPTEVPTSMPTLLSVPPAVNLILPSLSIFTQAVTDVLVPGMLLQNMQFETFGISVSVTPIGQRVNMVIPLSDAAALDKVSAPFLSIESLTSNANANANTGDLVVVSAIELHPLLFSVQDQQALISSALIVNASTGISTLSDAIRIFLPNIGDPNLGDLPIETETFVTECPDIRFMSTNFTCAGTNVTIYHVCDGVGYTLKSKCPTHQEAPGCTLLNLNTSTSTANGELSIVSDGNTLRPVKVQIPGSRVYAPTTDNCRVVEFNISGTLCECPLSRITSVQVTSPSASPVVSIPVGIAAVAAVRRIVPGPLLPPLQMLKNLRLQEIPSPGVSLWALVCLLFTVGGGLGAYKMCHLVWYKYRLLHPLPEVAPNIEVVTVKVRGRDVEFTVNHDEENEKLHRLRHGTNDQRREDDDKKDTVVASTPELAHVASAPAPALTAAATATSSSYTDLARSSIPPILLEDTHVLRHPHVLRWWGTLLYNHPLAWLFHSVSKMAVYSVYDIACKCISITSYYLVTICVLCALHNWQYPAYVPACYGPSTEKACLEVTALLDPWQPLCQWSVYANTITKDSFYTSGVPHFKCSSRDIGASATCAFGLMLLASMLVPIAVLPLEYILKMVNSPIMPFFSTIKLLDRRHVPAMVASSFREGSSFHYYRTLMSHMQRSFPESTDTGTTTTTTTTTTTATATATAKKNLPAISLPVTVPSGASLTISSLLDALRITRVQSVAKENRREFDRCWGLQVHTRSFRSSSDSNSDTAGTGKQKTKVVDQGQEVQQKDLQILESVDVGTTAETGNTSTHVNWELYRYYLPLVGKVPRWFRLLYNTYRCLKYAIKGILKLFCLLPAKYHKYTHMGHIIESQLNQTQAIAAKHSLLYSDKYMQGTLRALFPEELVFSLYNIQLFRLFILDICGGNNTLAHACVSVMYDRSYPVHLPVAYRTRLIGAAMLLAMHIALLFYLSSLWSRGLQWQLVLAVSGLFLVIGEFACCQIAEVLYAELYLPWLAGKNAKHAAASLIRVAASVDSLSGAGNGDGTATNASSGSGVKSAFNAAPYLFASFRVVINSHAAHNGNGLISGDRNSNLAIKKLASVQQPAEQVIMQYTQAEPGGHGLQWLVPQVRPQGYRPPQNLLVFIRRGVYILFSPGSYVTLMKNVRQFYLQCMRHVLHLPWFMQQVMIRAILVLTATFVGGCIYYVTYILTDIRGRGAIALVVTVILCIALRCYALRIYIALRHVYREVIAWMYLHGVFWSVDRRIERRRVAGSDDGINWVQVAPAPEHMPPASEPESHTAAPALVPSKAASKPPSKRRIIKRGATGQNIDLNSGSPQSEKAVAPARELVPYVYNSVSELVEVVPEDPMVVYKRELQEVCTRERVNAFVRA